MTEDNKVMIVVGEYVNLGAIRALGPIDVVRRASAVASELARVIEDRKLYATIKGRKHVLVEGWSTLGAMLGVMPREVSAERREDGGYIAKVELVRVNDGMIVGAGSALCGVDEKRWSKAEEYARRSMAITRATGKAYRLGFSWIVTLAGYEPTPAEEMPRASDTTKKSSPTRAGLLKRWNALTAEAQGIGMAEIEPLSKDADTEEIVAAGKALAGRIKAVKAEWAAQANSELVKCGAAQNPHNAAAMLALSNLKPSHTLDQVRAWGLNYRGHRDSGDEDTNGAATKANAGIAPEGNRAFTREELLSQWKELSEEAARLGVTQYRSVPAGSTDAELAAVIDELAVKVAAKKGA